jgi:hypothetical protein
MKILSDNKITNYFFIASLGFIVILMLSSFLMRIMTSPIQSELDADTEKVTEIEQVIQINILNACGKRGLAGEVKTYLTERGFDVVEIGNYTDTLEKSVIVDRLGDLQSSNHVAFAMGIDDSYVTSEIDSALYVRSTIIIGKDYFELKPFSSRN